MPTMRERVEQLKARKDQNLAGGGPDRVARQKAKNKLTVRERIDLLFDKGTFEEYGLLAAEDGALPDEEEPDRRSPADAGRGRRLVCRWVCYHWD